MYKDIQKKFMTYFCGDPEYYRDYKYLQDEMTVLKNPHKGWYWHFIDNGMSRSVTRKGVTSYAYRAGEDDYNIDAFPGMHHLYLRIDWSDIEKEEGVFDWSEIDSIFEKYGKLGYKFTFRLCTYEGILHDDFGYATPEWVKNAGAEGWTEKDGSWLPKLDDPIFLEKLENFMREFGGKYNNNPLVEYVDIGTIGIWGEGNCIHQVYDNEMYKKHINLHLKYFPDKIVVVNDDMINCAAYNPNADRKKILDYTLSRGLGFRDDSILWIGTTTGDCGYDTARTPFMFDLFAPNAPVDIELDHMRSIKDDVYKDGTSVYEALKRAHATYCGFHGYPEDWLNKYPYLTKHLANKLGYWYFVNGASIPELVSGYPAVIKLWFENKGFCHAYNAFDLKIKLVSEDSGDEYIVFENCGMNLNWKSETVTEETLKLSLKDVPSGKYTLCIGMFDGNTPIKLGFKSECDNGDGFYQFDSVEVF